MQPVLERGSIDKHLISDFGLIQLSFIPVCSPICDLVSRARRILRAHVYCARRKERRGENTSGVFGQVFVCTAGMLAVPIRLQHQVININII